MTIDELFNNPAGWPKTEVLFEKPDVIRPIIDPRTFINPIKTTQPISSKNTIALDKTNSKLLFVGIVSIGLYLLMRKK